MRTEIRRTVELLSSFASPGHPGLEAFLTALQTCMVARYDKHWYPFESIRGSGYRCLQFDDQRTHDPLLSAALHESGLPGTTLNAFPLGLSIWVDPGMLSYRIGEKGSVCDIPVVLAPGEMGEESQYGEYEATTRRVGSHALQRSSTDKTSRGTLDAPYAAAGGTEVSPLREVNGPHGLTRRVARSEPRTKSTASRTGVYSQGGSGYKAGMFDTAAAATTMTMATTKSKATAVTSNVNVGSDGAGSSGNTANEFYSPRRALAIGVSRNGSETYAGGKTLREGGPGLEGERGSQGGDSFRNFKNISSASRALMPEFVKETPSSPGRAVIVP